VRYGRLVDIGRAVVEAKTARPPLDRLKRAALAFALPRSGVFAFLLGAGRALRPLLPRALREKIPAKAAAGAWPAPRHTRKMLVLRGCVQPALAPSINAAAARVLDRMGISLIEAPAGCCGALRFHLNDQDGGREDMRALIDAWWPMIAMTRDLSEILEAEDIPAEKRGRVAFQSPCTLQHGQKIRGRVEELLKRAGYELLPVEDAHLCCGSAGTYSLLHPPIARELRARKLKALQANGPDVIATANIGCLSHLQGGTPRPMRHWIELLDVESAP
jgi:glycolate oxidase iron-sulfur subunit